MSFDEIFDLTAGVYFNFYNIISSQIFLFAKKGQDSQDDVGVVKGTVFQEKNTAGKWVRNRRFRHKKAGGTTYRRMTVKRRTYSPHECRSQYLVKVRTSIIILTRVTSRKG